MKWKNTKLLSICACIHFIPDIRQTLISALCCCLLCVPVFCSFRVFVFHFSPVEKFIWIFYIVCTLLHSSPVCFISRFVFEIPKNKYIKRMQNEQRMNLSKSLEEERVRGGKYRLRNWQYFSHSMLFILLPLLSAFNIHCWYEVCNNLARSLVSCQLLQL
jgi:hypothetical protein